jgi:3D (Asp-Asp-Asp) domain-containing protein
MNNGLADIPRNTPQLLRVTLISAAVALAIGFAAIGSARTAEPTITQVNSAAQSALPSKAAAVEMMHDLPAVEIKPATKLITMEVTAYCACTRCCGPNAQGITASGKDVSYNSGKFVAADRSMAFGTRLIIPGYDAQPVEVIDRGGAIKGNKLDVFFPTHQEALEWGRRTVEVTVLQ